MKKNSIKNYIDNYFGDIKMTAELYSLKDNIEEDINKKLWENIALGLSYDDAFDKATKDTGDINKMIKSLKEIEQTRKLNKAPIKPVSKISEKAFYYIGYFCKILLSVWFFLLLGFLANAWAWSWIIIPVSVIVFSNFRNNQKLIYLSPFVYIMLSFLSGGSLWSYAWVIIPLSLLLFSNNHF